LLATTWSYFEARGTVWTFSRKLEVPPRTADDCNFLQRASEAFYAAAGHRDAWPRCITFISVHCEITELMSAYAANAVLIPVRVFIQAGSSTENKWETWLPPSNRRPLRGGLCGNEEFESASTEARSVSSGWLEIIADGKLCRNNTCRRADARQARAPPLLPDAVRTRIECAHSLELPSFRQARVKSASTSSASKSSSSTANDAGGSDGGKRRRKGPGSASSTCDHV
jgi:hypothetical protein